MKSLDIHKSEYLKQFETQVYGRNLFRTQEEERLDAPNEECGIFGLYSDNDLIRFLFHSSGFLLYSTEARKLVVFLFLKMEKLPI
jgi:amidophosphoribosyltransferase